MCDSCISLRAAKKRLAILLDPAKPYRMPPKDADWVLVGGSVVAEGIDMDGYVRRLRNDMQAAGMTAPVILFPGSGTQLTAEADGLLLLVLMSGRNPEFLVEQQVRYARRIRESRVEVIPTAYILVDGGTETSTMRVTGTKPIAQTDIEMIVNTAVAAELMGQQAIYLEAGSGAKNPVEENVIQAVREAVDLPLIVGGGIRSRQAMARAYRAGADIVVVGNWLEEHETLL